jgi:hypothetical protein
MALDRAFALEPHGGTLYLRGKVLRQAGRYLAAEVAFEGASQAAEFPAQREAAEREIRITRRYAAFPGSKPEAIPPLRRWFAETGSVPLTGMPGGATSESDLVDGMAALTRELGWHFTMLVALDPWERWYDLAQSLGIPVAAVPPSDPAAIPLIAMRHADPQWSALADYPMLRGRGASLALLAPAAMPAPDLGGHLIDTPGRALDLAFAKEAARHPEGRLKGRVLW